MGNVRKREAKGINPFTDFGFKYIFGQETTTDLLTDFINSILEGDRQVTEITYMNTEVIPDTIGGKKVIFDILVTRQQTTGAMYDLEPSYLICLTKFEIPQYKEMKHTFALKDDNGARYGERDLLKLIIIQMSRFDKKVDELRTNEERWLYLLKNLEEMETLPNQFDDKVLYEKLMEISRLDRLDPRNAEIYEESLKSYMDLQSAFSYQKKQGIAEGMQKGLQKGMEKGLQKGIEQGFQKGRLAIAKAMKQNGASDEFIAQCTGMTPEEISNL